MKLGDYFETTEAQRGRFAIWEIPKDYIYLVTLVTFKSLICISPPTPHPAPAPRTANHLQARQACAVQCVIESVRHGQVFTPRGRPHNGLVAAAGSVSARMMLRSVVRGALRRPGGALVQKRRAIIAAADPLSLYDAIQVDKILLPRPGSRKAACIRRDDRPRRTASRCFPSPRRRAALIQTHGDQEEYGTETERGASSHHRASRPGAFMR